ncbi:GTPase Era, mitochondrial [Hylaeus volcanicus]|uniref:GTPase Era, mitochondrial n=1 Tax=Hylaeus volcanicus TaxID=313075 RepID=UPI0023B83A75|nr:GTPase Era, mitochondrial [Hylaeus volcanicus]
MLFAFRKCTRQIELHFLKRLITFSTVPHNEVNQEEYTLKPDEDVILRREHSKFLKVAIVGLPNAGKSTLINNLAKRSLCPTSSKVHTTMHKCEAVYSEGDTQIVFMDTPGFTSHYERKKYKLKETFTKDPLSSIVEADVIGLLQDATNIYTRHKINQYVLDYLKNRRNDSSLLLIFNKVDMLKNKFVLLEMTRQFIKKSESLKFDDIFMISALTGDGIDDLRNYLLDSAKLKDWQYRNDVCTDQPLETVVTETVRAKLMDNLQQEIPYNIKLTIEHLDVGKEGTISVTVLLECDKERYHNILFRKRGRSLRATAEMAENELRNAFRTNVLVRLVVKCENMKKQEHR